VIERDPERSSDRAFLEDRGLAHLALGNKQAALADLEQALDVTPPEDQVSIARLQKLIKPLL
jgi:regulator of sirC expression with transglutaminase-like and TPR domain